MFSKNSLLAKIVVDTEENEPYEPLRIGSRSRVGTLSELSIVHTVGINMSLHAGYHFHILLTQIRFSSLPSQSTRTS